VLWAGSEVCDLYLGSASSGLAQPGQLPNWQAHTDVAQGFTQRLGELRGQRRRWRRTRLRVWLSAALVRPFVMTQVAGLKGTREVQAMAKEMAAAATGLETDCEVWLSQSLAVGSALCVALPADIRQAILASAKTEGVTLFSLRPWWAAALNETLTQQAGIELFAALDSDALTVLMAKDGAWLSADSYTPRPEPLQLDALVTRLMFASTVDSDKACRVRLNELARSGGQPWPMGERVSAFAAP
jgi:hypothetical protein